MTAPRPRVAVFAGINGAGKSTASRRVLVDVLGIRSFVNADAIARGLNGIDPESVAFNAGRVMVEYLDVLAKARADIALETTLTARSYASWLGKRRAEGYAVYLYYYWLNSPDMAVERVAKRVAAGGHHIPEETIRRRYANSIKNFFDLYQPLCTEWEVYDNSVDRRSTRIASMTEADGEVILDAETWEQIQRSANDE